MGVERQAFIALACLQAQTTCEGNHGAIVGGELGSRIKYLDG